MPTDEEIARFRDECDRRIEEMLETPIRGILSQTTARSYLLRMSDAQGCKPDSINVLSQAAALFAGELLLRGQYFQRVLGHEEVTSTHLMLAIQTAPDLDFLRVGLENEVAICQTLLENNKARAGMM